MQKVVALFFHLFIRREKKDGKREDEEGERGWKLALSMNEQRSEV